MSVLTAEKSDLEVCASLQLAANAAERYVHIIPVSQAGGRSSSPWPNRRETVEPKRSRSHCLSEVAVF